ncbi:MAG: hypothetical protein Q7R30_24080 [Acidobacteriota bacterium]|nr:hypothetical protein [Acidobacteriota bacterium]
MPLRRLAIVSLAVIAALTASPVPPTAALAQSPNPCVAALAAEGATAMRTPPFRAPKYGRFGADTRDIRDLLQLSAVSSQARSRATSTGARPAADRDDNNIAILEDNGGDLILRANPFDLANTGLRFEPAGAGYAVTITGAEFRAALGRTLTLGDDDSVAQTIAFPFEFYGRRFTSLFVNSDGNLTFEEGDNASTARGLARLASGAPRIAPFFADLDPSAGGRVFFDSAPDAITITWCAVPGFGLPQAMTVQSVLFANGAIEFRFGVPDLTNGIVALSPGRTETVTALDLRTGGQVTEPVAFGELFTASPSLDLVAATRRFYQSHPDNFEQLVFWTDTTVVTTAFAFESTVKNAITGTGLEVFDFSAELGSGGSLESVINMDRISKYPDTPAAKIFGEISALGILAHETGHRWLARLLFRNADRSISDQLLGRQLAHWSFFMDSDGSVMEGNEIEDLGGGAFRTAAATEKYSRLDLYAMGLATDAEVPRWFFIDAPISDRTRESGPFVGSTITGTRRDVLIQDVIDALGPRAPAAADSPRLHRQAFVFVRLATAVLNPQDLTRLARIREEFGPFFSRATENRMTVRTTLAP